jgi:hypothetical protein
VVPSWRLCRLSSSRDFFTQKDESLDVQIEVIKTSGDVKKEPLSVIGGKGVFTKELEDALLDGRIESRCPFTKGPSQFSFRRNLRSQQSANEKTRSTRW